MPIRADISIIDPTTPGQIAGVDSSGRLKVTGSLTPSGTQDVNIAQVAGATVDTGHGTAAGALRVELPTDGTGVVIPAGNVAAGASDSGNPIKAGGVARTANASALTDGQRSNVITDSQGRPIVTIGTARELVSHATTTIASSTSETTIIAATSGEHHDILSLVITNASATIPVTVTIKDSTAGTTRMIFDLAAAGGIVVNPARAIPQLAATNNNWTATLSVNTVTVDIFAMWQKEL